VVFYGGDAAGEVWALDLGDPLAPTWTRLETDGMTPAGRGEAALIYQAVGDRLLVSGGGESPAVHALVFGGTAAIPPAATPGPPPGPLLHGASPNPASGPIEVSFELAASERCRLELYDVTGRSFAAQELGVLGPGPHRVELGQTELPTGVYLVRLVHGMSALNAKVSVLR
jgi:hypothetical protein